jgi:hypothetical protein
MTFAAQIRNKNVLPTEVNIRHIHGGKISTAIPSRVHIHTTTSATSSHLSSTGHLEEQPFFSKNPGIKIETLTALLSFPLNSEELSRTARPFLMAKYYFIIHSSIKKW